MNWRARLDKMLHGNAISAEVLLVLLCCSPSFGQQAPPPTITVSPSRIEMGAFYNGAPVHMQGTVPAKSEVMVIIRGKARDEVFNHKGRLGPIWVNKDKIHVSGTPSLFLRFSSADMHALIGRDLIDRYGLDELSMRHRIHLRLASGEPDAAYRDKLVNSYIDLKKSDGTYRRVGNQVHTVQEAGLTHYHVEFEWPKTAVPGSYMIEVYAVVPGAVLGQASAELQLVEVGFPAAVVKMAEQRPWLYGLIAVLAAACAGFGMDAVVSRLRPCKVGARAAPAPEAAATASNLHEEVHVEEHSHHH